MSTFAQIQLGTLGAVLGPLAVNISPGNVYAGGYTATITTLTVTAYGVGGSAPYTYSWTKVSGNAINVASALTAATAFNATTMVSPSDRIAVYRCTVTDSLAATSYSDITVECERF